MELKFEKKHVMILVVVVILIFLFYPMPKNNSETKEVRQCQEDEDCLIFGETGTCNCGCYNATEISELEKNRAEGCFCLPPEECECVNNECMRKA